MRKRITTMFMALLLVVLSVSSAFTCFAEDDPSSQLFNFAIDFSQSGLDSSSTEWDIIQYMKNQGINLDLRVKGKLIDSEAKYNELVADGTISENDGAEITDDGRLRIFATKTSADTSSTKHALFAPITDRLSAAKCVKVELDIQLPQYEKGGAWGGTAAYVVRLDHTGGAYLRIDGLSGGTGWQLQSAGKDLASVNSNAHEKSHKLTLISNIENGTTQVSFDDVTTTYTAADAIGKPFANVGTMLGFRTGTGLMEVRLKSISISEVLLPEVTDRFTTDGATAVATDAPVLKFNLPISQAEAQKIKLYKKGSETPVSDLEYTLSDGGKTLTIGEGLEYSTPYQLVIPDGVMAENKMTLPPETINFHTMHKPYPIETPSVAFKKNGTDAPITDLADPTLTTASVTATLPQAAGATGSEKVIMLVSIFRNGIVMEDVTSATGTVSDGTITADINLPADRTNLSIKAFIWDEYQKMNALGAEILYPAAP